jgi:hypothetical protein
VSTVKSKLLLIALSMRLTSFWFAPGEAATITAREPKEKRALDTGLKIEDRRTREMIGDNARKSSS